MSNNNHKHFVCVAPFKLKRSAHIIGVVHLIFLCQSDANWIPQMARRGNRNVFIWIAMQIEKKKKKLQVYVFFRWKKKLWRCIFVQRTRQIVLKREGSAGLDDRRSKMAHVKSCTRKQQQKMNVITIRVGRLCNLHLAWGIKTINSNIKTKQSKRMYQVEEFKTLIATNAKDKNKQFFF